jgi:hypothetical protein
MGVRAEMNVRSTVSSLPVRTPCQSNHAIVLCEGGHWGDGHEGSEKTVATISQNSTLNSRFEDWAIDLKIGNWRTRLASLFVPNSMMLTIASSSNITNSLASANNENCHHR